MLTAVITVAPATNSRFDRLMHGDVPSTMQSPVKGTVSDRPWGVTLGALGLDGRTGQLTLRADGRAYRVVFYRGAIVGATSPLAADSPVRVALTSHMITPTQAALVKQRLRTATANHDEVDLIAEAARLPSDLVEKLRAAVLTRCAARTFAIDHGHYVLEDRIGDVDIEGHVDVRGVVYFGVRMNLSDQRLAYDLRQLGSWFVLKPKTVDDLSGFGFGVNEAPILEALRGGTNLAALDARHRDIDPRTAQAVIYALAACDAVVCGEPPAMASTASRIVPSTPTVSRVPTRREPTPSIDRTPTPRAPLVSRVPTPRQPTLSRGDVNASEPDSTGGETSPWGHPTISPPALGHGTPGPAARAARGSNGIPRMSREDAIRQATESGFVDMRTTTVRPNALAAYEVEALIAARSTLLERGADHFAILGLSPGASAAEVRAAYAELARYLEPKKLAALGIRDDSYTARRLFAQVCIAVTVLTDPERRRAYLDRLR